MSRLPVLPVIGLFIAGMTVAGCASSSNMAGADGDFPPTFERRITEIPFTDADGRAHELPLLGGFNVPRPQLADIDADGDLDLFLQEFTGEVMFFENTGSPGDPSFEWRSDQYAGLDVGEWFRLLDLDGDGDMDILGETRFSYVRYFRNEGSAQQADFVLSVDTLRDATGTPIFADRQNIPFLADIDCDNLLDLFIGRVDGTITRYESVGMDENNVPQFRFVTDRFEDIEIVGENVSVHGANTMSFGDIDNDGDNDLLWGDFFEAGLLLIRNQGSCGAPSLRGEPQSWPLNEPVETSGYNAPVMVDFDADGDQDVFMGVLGGAFNANSTTIDNFYYLEQTSEGQFEKRTERFIYNIDLGSETIVKSADLDADGDLDLLVGNKIQPDNNQLSRVYHYENTGTPTAPAYVMRGPIELLGTYHQNPAFGDLDGDGDLDFLLGKWNREIGYFRNDGTATDFDFVEVDDAWLSITRGSNTTPALVDIDADGDLDLFVGESSGSLNFYRNTGSATEPSFELVSDSYLDIDSGRRSFPTFVDIDDDGDQDMVLGSELDGLYLYLNTGTPEQHRFELWGTLDVPVQPFSAPEFADVDGDGDMDLLVGGTSGGLQYFENVSR